MTSSGNSMKTYVINIRAKSKNLNRMEARIDEWILVSLLLNNLDIKYKNFVHRTITSLNEVPDFDKIVTLLHEEERLLKRDTKEQAMAAAMKRFKQEEDEKKTSGRGNSNRGRGSTRGRGGRNNNTTQLISKNPNSTNYKGDGDPPECPKCHPNKDGSKRLHWPYDCWTLHEDRISDRFRDVFKKTKAKANAVKERERPDDFEDNHSTHISAMTHLVIDQNTVADGEDEVWGFPFNATTSEFYDENIPKESIIETLDQSLPQLTEKQERESTLKIPQEEPVIQLAHTSNFVEHASTRLLPSSRALPDIECQKKEIIVKASSAHFTSQLQPTSNFCDEASRGAEEKLASQPEVVDFEIIDQLSYETFSYFRAYSAALNSDPTTSRDWMIDSGCTNHMFFDKDEFTEYRPYREGVIVINEVTVWTQERGTVEMEWLLLKEKRKKLDERNKKCYLIDYNDTFIFRIWNPASRKVERSSHVDFDETRLMTSVVQDTGYWLADVTGDDGDILDAEGDASEHHYTPHDVDDDPQEGSSLQHIQDVLDNASNVVEDLEDVKAASKEEFSKDDDNQISQNALDVHSDPSIDATYTSRPKRVLASSQKILLNEKWSDIKMWAQRTIAHIKCNVILQSKRMYCKLVIVDHENSQHHNFESEFDLANAVQKIAKMRRNQDIDDVDDYEPLTYKEAITDPYAKQWSEAINKQMQSFAIMNTWRLIKRSKNALVLSDKWVYKIKKRLDGTILYKARWVVRGFEQIYDVNYDQTFISVIKFMSFKVLFFIMIYYDLDCEQINVIIIFLNALLKKRIYVKQLKGYKNDEHDIMCLLFRVLYDLK